MGAQHLQNRQNEREILLHDNSSYGCTTSTEHFVATSVYTDYIMREKSYCASIRDDKHTYILCLHLFQ